MPIKAVLFDAAGVLTTPFTTDLVAGALDAGANADVLMNVLFPMFASAEAQGTAGNRLERGEISLQEFFASLGAHERDVRLVLDPNESTFFGHLMERNHVMHEFVREVSAAGFLTGLVSNNVREWQPVWDRLVASDLPFDVRLYSWQLGMRKPEARIYLAALGELGVGAGETIFVDDFAAMVDGAAAVGMYGVRFTDDEQAAAEVRELLVP